MAADLGDAAGVEEDDAVGGAGGLEAVGDDDRGAVGGEALHRGDDAGHGPEVEGPHLLPLERLELGHRQHLAVVDPGRLAPGPLHLIKESFAGLGEGPSPVGVDPRGFAPVTLAQLLDRRTG